MDIIVPKSVSSGGVTRATPATYYNSAGIMTYAPINGLRMNYDPLNLSAYPNPLIEGIGQSYAISSEHFNYPSGVIAGSNPLMKLLTKLAPDNTLSGSVFAENTSSGVHTLAFDQINPATFSTTVSAVYSIYVKASGRTQVKFSSADAFIFDLSAGTVTPVGTPTVSTAGIINIGNGWWRCYQAFAAGTGGSLAPAWNLTLINAGASSYAGDGMSGVIIFGLQQENSITSTPSSYIPTTPVFGSRTGTSTYVASTGFVTSGGTAARLNYSPSYLSATPKLLLEEGSTNVLIQGSTIGTTGWGQTGLTATPNTTTSPAGTLTASTLAATATTALQFTRQTATVTNDNGKYVFSVFVKKTSGATTFPGISLNLINGTTTLSSGVTINTDTGVLTVASTSPNITYKNTVDFGTYWRVVVGITNNTTGNTSLQTSIYAAVNTDASATWTVGVAGSVFVWGAQVEKGVSYETSYIPTTNAAVTRGADLYNDGYGDGSLNEGLRAADVFVYGLLYSNIPENDYPVWSATTTYAIGANVIYQHKIYNSLRASNLNFNPATDTTTPAYWLYTGPTNQYAMFDGQVGTLTTNNTGDIFVEIYLGATTAVSFNQISADSVTVTLVENGNTIYNTTLDVTGGTTGVPVTDITLTDLPSVSDAVMYVTIHAASGIVSCGNFVAGTVYYLGSTSTDPTIGITDYSIKTIDAFGNPTLTKRAYSKTMNTKSLLMTSAQIDLVARILSANRATPCVWNGNTSINMRTSNLYSSLIVYGYYNTWEIDVDTNNTYLTLQIEGLI